MSESRDGTAVSARLRSGALDVRAVTEQALRDADGSRAAGTFLTLTAERAAREARESRARHAAGRPLGPLDGVPVAVKDLFDVAGTVTTAGSRIRASAAPAARDAHVVRRLAEAGMICVGKTGLSELAFSGLGVNPHFGTPANPHDTSLIAGGSSSGSAVAVALGVVPVAIGTDTSGSVRVPAAFCGVTGFKASEDRYGKAGLLPLAPTLDSVGIFARSVRDIIAVDAALLAAAPVAEAGPLRLVLPAGPLLDDCAPEVRQRFEACVTLLESHGVPVEERVLPPLAEAQALIDAYGTIVEDEAYRRYGHLLGRPESGAVDPGVLRRLAERAARPRDAVAPVRRAMRGLRATLWRRLGGALLACPAVRHPPPALAPLLADVRRYDETNRRTLRTTMLLSYLGLPGVTLPIGTPGAGQAGLLLSAAPGRDAALLGAAARIEAVLAAGR